MALSTLARSSLKQFIIVYSDVRKENGEVTDEQLEALMWEKIIAGSSSGNKIPSAFLKKLKYDLPFLPEIINYMGCTALKPCGGLYTPCGAKQNEGQPFCASCEKHSAKYGSLADRGTVGNYTDPSDKHEISYGTWLAKNEFTIQQVQEDLTENGFTFQIPAEQLTVNSKRVTAPKRRPGRPGVVKKTKVNEDGSQSPMGTSLDGAEHQIVLEESDATLSSDDEDESPKKKALAKAVVNAKEASAESAPKKEKAEKVEKPKKEKAEKVEKPKKEKVEKPKKEKVEKPKKEKGEKKTNQADHEEESEEVVIDGKDYMMVGNKLFDDSGTLVGSLHNGKAEFLNA